MVRTLRRSYRIGLLSLHLLVGLLLAYGMGRARSTEPPAPGQWRLIQWWLRRAGRIVGLRITVHGRSPQGAVLAAANHISWLDILVLSSVLPVCFVSKAEVRDWPVVGTLASSSGTLFLNRGGRDAASRMTGQIGAYLRQGQSVLIFPEATTGDGHGVRRFHARLFGAAIEAAAPVLPIALRYPHPEGVNPLVPFIGHISFGAHAWRILGEHRVDAEVYLLEPIVPTDTDRKGLARRTHAAVEAVVTQATPQESP